MNNTLDFCCRISSKRTKELSSFPFLVDLLGDALHTENLRETAHCRILYGLLQNKDIQRDFIEYFLPDIDCSFESIEIPYPDKRRIYGAQNETYNDGKDVKWWNALSAKELRV